MRHENKEMNEEDRRERQWRRNKYRKGLYIWFCQGYQQALAD